MKNNLRQFRFLAVLATAAVLLQISSSQAQPQDAYVAIAARQSRSRIYYEAFALPGKGEKEVLVVAFKIPNDRLIYMRHHEGEADQEFRAAVDVTVELFQGSQRVDEIVWKSETFAASYEETDDPSRAISGAVAFRVESGNYGYRILLNDMNTEHTSTSFVRPVQVPNYDDGALGKAIIAGDVDEADLFHSVKLANFGGDARFGERAVAVVPLTLGPEVSDPTILWTLRRLDPVAVEKEMKRRQKMAKEERRKQSDGEIPPKMYKPRTLEGGLPVDSGSVSFDELIAVVPSVAVDIVPDKVRLTAATDADTERYYVALIDLHGEKLENGAYALDLQIAGIDSARTTTQFATHWPDMPFSLYDIDVAIKNLKFIVDKNQIKALKSGSKEDKIVAFTAFWKERDPTPESAYNELMVEYYRRLDFAAMEYRTGAGFAANGLKTDRARYYIVFGPPDDLSRFFPASGGVLETWSYTDGRKFVFEAVSSIDPFYLVEG